MRAVSTLQPVGRSEKRIINGIMVDKSFF